MLNTEWPQSLKDIEKLSNSEPSSEDISLSIDKKPYEDHYKDLQITEIELVDCSSWNFFKWGPPGTTIGWISHHEPPDIRVKDKKVTADDKGYFSMLASLVGHKIVKMDDWDDEGFYDADDLNDYYAFVFDNGTIAEVVNGGFTGDGYFPSLYDTKHFKPYGSLTYLKPCLTSF